MCRIKSINYAFDGLQQPGIEQHDKSTIAIKTSRHGALQWRIRPDLLSSTLCRILEDPDACLADPAHHYKHYELATIGRVPPSAGDHRGLVLRRLNYGSFRAALRDFFRRSRAHRAFERGLLMEKAAIQTPRSLAFAECRQFGWPRKAYVATEEVSGAQSLGRIVIDQGRLPRIAIARTAELLARMHDAGFSHRDLKYSNILLDPHFQPWLIDLDGVRVVKNVTRSRAVSDLAVLAWDFRRHPKLLLWYGARFLKRYCRLRNLDSQFRQLAREILVAANRR